VISKYLPKYGIEYSYVSAAATAAEWEAAILPTTKMIYIETPTNPGLEVLDIAMISAIAKKHGIILNVDNCFATPIGQTPIDLGADIVVHSATKWIDGQGRVLGGAVVGRNDLIHEIYLDKYNYKKNANLKNNIIYSADHIICISNNTKKDLINFYKVEEPKITVIYLGYETSKEITMIENINIIRPFFLYVGSRGRYKNFLKFLEAFSLSKLLKNNLDIYCFGGGDFTTKELDIIKSLEIDLSQVKYFHGDDKKLNYLYLKAHAFVFPSLYEGFGLPLLEAMNMGCPVVCSNTSSFPEVVNDAALLFDPESKEDIKVKLEEIFANVNLKKKLIEKGYNNLQRFSWKKCAEETLSVYKI
jgi:glycosyltransferase involved in cell wall biosynthesis